MTNNAASIKCKKCGNTFQPDVKTKGPWVCPGCLGKNPNLKRLYRSVADVCILGLIVTVLVIAVRINERRVDFGVILAAAHSVLLLVTIVSVYRSETPWKDTTARILLWTVFGLALLFNLLIPLLFVGLFVVFDVVLPPLFVETLVVPASIVYLIIFAYLVWLNSQANKCMAPEPPRMPSEEQS
jgi:hypothetical protein